MAARSHSIAFVLVTICLDSMGFGLVMPVLPRLLMNTGGLDLSQAIEIGSWMGLAMAIAAFIAAPVLGNLSDAYGRRRVLLIALGGLAVDYLLMALAQTLPLIFLGRVLSGLFGGSYGPAQAAIADMTPPEDRARRFGLVGAAFGFGFIIGPALGGLLTSFGERTPFYVASALAALNFLYGLTIFPETLPPERRRKFTASRANPLGALRVARANPGMLQAAAVLMLWQMAGLVYPMTWSFYGIAQLGWSDKMIGLSLTAVGVMSALSQILLTGRLVRKWGERGAAQLGMVTGIAIFIAYAFTTSTVLAFALILAMALQSSIQPSLMAILSRRATPETQGEIQGISAMTMGIGAIFAPLLLTAPMAWFTGPDAPVHFPGVAFIIAALLATAALLLLRRMPRITPK